MNDAIDFSFYPNEEEQQEEEEKQQQQQQRRERKAKQQQQEHEQEEELANADLLRQFRQLFAPIVNDSLKLYYQLNESDTDVQHIRIHRTVAELNELTSSEEETLITQLNSPSPLPQLVETPTPTPTQLPLQEETPSVSSMMSSTSSSCLYAIHTPSPAQRLESPQSEVSEAPLTITEQVQLHAPPSSHADNNNIINDGLDDDPNSSSHNNNNTSCSISSTLTDSKTLDGRTPIVV